MFGDARRTDGYACASIVRVSGSVGSERIRRPLHRVLKPSPTIGDLAGSDFREVQPTRKKRCGTAPAGGFRGVGVFRRRFSCALGRYDFLVFLLR